jgi:hypothetical protein
MVSAPGCDQGAGLAVVQGFNARISSGKSHPVLLRRLRKTRRGRNAPSVSTDQDLCHLFIPNRGSWREAPPFPVVRASVPCRGWDMGGCWFPSHRRDACATKAAMRQAQDAGLKVCT